MGRPPNPKTPQPISSPEDADLQVFWWSYSNGYARRWFFVPDGGKKMILMHRIIASRIASRPILATEEIDHINGNKSDNRRENLRIVTSLQNSQNRHCYGPFRGTCWVKEKGKWVATVGHKRRLIFCGYFDTQPEAASAAAAKRAELGFLTNKPVLQLA